MTKVSKQYQVLDALGNIVATGTLSECAAKLGCSLTFVQDHLEGTVKYPYYWIIPARFKEVPIVYDEPAKTDEEFIRRWDEMMTPLRKKYRIPRYKPKPDRR